MATTEQDISIKRNDTRRHIFILQESGVVLDISGWTSFEFAVNTEKLPVDDSNQIGIMTGFLVTDGTDGAVYFVPPGSWAIGKYFYDAQSLDSNGERITFVKGKYTIVQDITKV